MVAFEGFAAITTSRCGEGRAGMEVRAERNGFTLVEWDDHAETVCAAVEELKAGG